MNWFQSLLFGFVSGITEFLPISSSSHEAILLQIFGVTSTNYLLKLMMHLGMLIGIFIFCDREVSSFRRDMHNASRKRNAGAFPVVRGCTILLLLISVPITVFFYSGIERIAQIILLTVNGFAIFLFDRFSRGNKEMKSGSLLDMLLLGLLGGAAVFPGLSRTALLYGGATALGFEQKSASAFCILLSIPALAVFIVADTVFLFINGVAGFSLGMFLCCFLAMFFAFIGTFIGTLILRMLSQRTAGLAFYCWGLALLSFILYILF